MSQKTNGILSPLFPVSQYHGEIDSDGENEETVPVPPKRAKKNPRAQNKGVDADEVLPIPHLNNDDN